MNDSASPADRRSLLQSSLQALEAMEAKLAAAERARTEPIAVIGMSCRFPGGVTSPESYWQLLHEGRDGVSTLPPERRAIAAAYGIEVGDDSGARGWHGGFIDQIDQFDPGLFGITPREALSMDPQQRLVLEVAWEAIERSGRAPDSLVGSRTGIFLGISTNDYGDLVMSQGPEKVDAYAATGCSMNVAAGRVSFVLGLQGPAMAVDSACSSSLVAVHLAVQSLRSGESTLALAGGVNAVLMPHGFLSFSNWGMMASDGRCKAFDARADGFVRSEGCGLLLLKRLRDAQADGDPILAVIRGSAVNQDGRSSGLTVPNGRAQQTMLQQAYESAGIKPGQVQYVEAHGTGTAIGDPIEVEAIGAVLGKGRSVDRPLFLSSVKTNIGHAESAAGIAGLIKVILSMQHGEIPPMLHLQERSPKVPWPDFPIELPVTPTPWPGENGVRIAGVSGFGFSGTNAHVVLSSAPAEPQAAPESTETAPALRVLTLSAKSTEGVRAGAERLAAHLAAHPELALADVCYTANTGRTQFAQRLAVVAEESADLQAKLAGFAQGATGAVAVGATQGRPPRVAFLFTGQGAQYAGMGRGLYDRYPVFRAALDRCAQLLSRELDTPLLELLFGEADGRIDQTAYTQPALVALEYALAMLWQSWGITPAAVIGHSVGEYAAAIVAGVMSLEDGLRLVAARGRLMQALPAGGAMAAILAPFADVEPLVAAQTTPLDVAAVNGPEHTVVSGDAAAAEAVMAHFAATGVRVQRLTVSHAFHSPLMDPILAPFEQVAASLSLRPARIPLLSNLTGTVAGDEVTTPGYWRRHIREAVRFGAGIEALRGLEVDVLLEVGPHPTLLGMAQQIPAAPETVAAAGLPSLRRNRDDVRVLLDSVAQLYVRGASINWSAFDEGTAPRKVLLPTYPFQRARYWVDLPLPGRLHQQELAPGDHPLLGRRLKTPLLRQTIFESRIRADAPSFLADHRVMGATLFPGTAFIELALAAAAAATDGGDGPFTLAHLTLSEPLPLHDETVTLQTMLTPEADGLLSVQIASIEPGNEEVAHTHATGAVRPADVSSLPTADLPALRARCTQAVDVTSFYESLADKQLEYGPAFRGVTELWHGEGVALGRVELPDAAGAGEPFRLHPALLDACFHVIGAAVAAREAGVPVGITGFTILKPAATQLWCAAEILHGSGANERTLSCRLLLLDDAGELVAYLERLDLVSAPSDMRHRQSTAAWLYEAAWKPQPLPDHVAPNGDSEGAGWLLLTDAAAPAADLAGRLQHANAGVTIVHAGTHTQQHSNGQWEVDPCDATAFNPILQAAGALQGVVCLWHNPGDLEAADVLATRQEMVLSATLHMAQSLGSRTGAPPRLWIVTSGAQPVDDSHAVQAADAPLWGLGRVIAAENPALRCTLVDLNGSDGDLGPLVDELLANGEENQVALHGGARSVARLAHIAPHASGNLPAGLPYQLELPARGLLDKLQYAPLDAPLPGPGEVAVTVYASGLNFRDVLNVLGMYPGDPGLPGIECAGVVSAVGEGVTRFAVGDAVVGLASRSFNAVVITPATLMAHKPATISFAEAATVPSAFLTAYYGLHTLAGLQPGERVLIHAAAGGVGLAAVQVAQRLGAEVFTTAGSATKHAYLRSVGVDHIFSSRTANFREQILELTGGHGVDVVLNSLSGDFIRDSFALLAPNGRFLEIGKRDIWTHEQVAAVRPDVGYLPYDLGDPLRDTPHVLMDALEELLAQMTIGHHTPLPLRAFPAAEIVDAYRFMAQARHIGKVVITHQPSGWQGQVRSDGAYLVTGGLGGIGLKVAAWLVEKGAGVVALMGRRAPSPAAAESIEALRAHGMQLLVLEGDVGRGDDVARALRAIAETGAPLRGIYHAAGLLDDGTLPQQSWPRFATVFAPKVIGAWNLHEATVGAPLDHFVLFSSASALLGSPGQANYAAANAYLDALAHQRRAAGLPALSVNWGAWAEVGMAAALAGHDQRRVTQSGMAAIPPAQGIAALELLLESDQVQAAVLPINWRKLREQLGDGPPPLFLVDLVQAAPAPAAASARPSDATPLRALLAAAPQGERHTLVVERLIRHVAEVTGIDSSAAGPTLPLSDIGLDSLMAVELKNRIDRDLQGGKGQAGVALAALLAGPTINQLAADLAAQFEAHHAAADGEAKPSGEANPTGGAGPNGGAHVKPEDALANVDQLSDDEVNAMLAALMREQGGS